MINVFDDDKEEQVEEQNPVDEPPLSSTADEMHPFGNYCLLDHNSSMQMHIHPYLTIIIDGEEYEIPSNAGIDTDTCPGAMHMTHTHDNSGKLHVENYTKEDVPLEVFFDVWGKHFNETGIFDYRVNETHSMRMTVDGIESTEFDDLLLLDGQSIAIFYE